MPESSRSGKLALLLLSIGLARCGADPQVITGSGEGSGGTSSGGSGVGLQPNKPDVMLPSGGDSSTGMGGVGGGCSEPGCEGTTCGNSELEDGEVCDDGNARPGDGCSGLCRVEPNFECEEPGKACVSTVACGDSQVSGAEACDDGGTEEGDGCDAECQVEDGFACSVPGRPCRPVSTAECGDGAVNFGETCDDGDTEGDDGCSDVCSLEPGFRCATPGEACEPLQFCGDAKLSDQEDCDDGNTTPGDGCTGRCTLEPFHRCPTPGKPCETTIVCGDLDVVGDEACDDGNTRADDGCAADCKSVEPGYVCPNDNGLGGVCEESQGDVCGDAVVSFGEFCDDGNSNPSDGCTDECEVTPGYDCPNPGQLCQRIAWCGDGDLSPANGEQCDDGEDPPQGGDGCSALCIIEDLWDCLVPGEPCVSRVDCGDRVVMADETCDDGNQQANDGCDNDCQLEDGWICPPGTRCRARECGDGIVAGNERCDDGDTGNDIDGCSATCQLQPGFACEGEPSVCTPTECGDGDPEGSEQCDNDVALAGQTPLPFDGCSSTCTWEPDCGCDGCADVCGDGMKFETEDCDDGNLSDGDGCDSDCNFEPGYDCTDQVFTDTQPCSANASQQCLVLPIVYRDFRGHDGGGECPNNANVYSTSLPLETPAHPQFGIHPINDGLLTGIVQTNICANGRPAYNTNFSGETMNGAQYCAATPATLTNTTAISNAFAQWYTDAGVNRRVNGTLELGTLSGGRFQFDRSSSNSNAALRSFFPLDGLGFGNLPGYTHNFHFTSEMRYWFYYQGGETFEFRGDDDVWVFVNGQLVVDLGGIHSEWIGKVVLNGAQSQVCIPSLKADSDGDPDDNCVTRNIPLTAGNVYEIALFQAERHVTQSNYKLTLSNFNVQRTSCTPDCGDGFVTPDEACDLGDDENTGEHDGCNADCTLSPFCGDTVTQSAEEECDNGANVSTYGVGANACAPGCVRPPFCGDDIVQGAYEVCDEGDDNGPGYGRCGTNCQPGPRCGDGVTQSPQEECDDVRGRVVYNGTSSSACSATCQLKCGNGDTDAGEQCDDGEDENTGGYGNCSATCRLGPRCGDGIRQANEGEACDDGQNDGDYGECAPGCELGPRCGDGDVQADAGERCDEGADNVAAAYGEDICTTQCRPAPYCGDSAVDVAFGEQCDDGVNDGTPGSCEVDCSGWVPLPNCGDGNRDDGEQCDEGNQNGTSGSSCDARCRERCGNGVVDDGEQCDDGINDGSFGTCNSDCTLAGYCGDGNRDAPFEQCDEGDDNEDSAYGRGLCTTGCARAPFCGDGRIQADFGEKCDGTAGCDRTRCVYFIPE